MANTRKRISELTALASASLDTTLVGVDGGTTYKIELDTLADAVTSRVNILDRSRLSSLESVTSSFETKGRSLISSSAQISALGFTSSSADLTSLNSFTSSQTTLNSAFTNGINARLQTSSFNEFSASVHNEIVAATNEQDLSAYVTQLVVNTLSSSVDSRIDNLEANSGSYLTSLSGAISSSSQLTSSFDTRYTLSGSVQPLPSNLISSSAQITTFGFISSSQTINTGSLATTGSNTFSGSQIISGALYVTGLTSISTSFSLPTGSSLLILSGSNIYVDASGSITGSLSGSVFGIGDVVAFSSSVNNRINNITSSIIPDGLFAILSQVVCVILPLITYLLSYDDVN